MGLEADCRARYAGQAGRGRARFEETEIIFRGDFRLNIPLAEVRSVEVKAGTLRLGWPGGVAAFELGPAAQKWAFKLKNPRGLLDKLGVKPGLRVSVLGRFDDGFPGQIASRTPDLSVGRVGKDSDLVFVTMRRPADLARLATLRTLIKKNGAIWVVWPKGRKEFREDDVRAAGPGAGLVDVKVVSFSEELSALKMVIPRKER